jgi:uncharacterized protein
MQPMNDDRVLIDTSFLYALADPSDKYRGKALAFAQSSNAARVIPDVVLPEVTYLLRRFVSQTSVLRFLAALSASESELVALTNADLRRVHEIMEHYADARFDFVDCCIMALSERLSITQVCTFDRRDFAIFRPAHSDYLELLP